MTARTYLLRQNSEMRKDNIWNWTLPAWVIKDSTGKAVNVCPQAGACVKLCYARNGTYMFQTVRAAHTRNLEMTYDLGAFAVAMLDELGTRRYRATGVPRLPGLPRTHLSSAVAELLDAGCAAVRVHDAGDFYSDDYLRTWLHIAQLTPHVLFFAYTKEVSRMRRVAGTEPPPQFPVVLQPRGPRGRVAGPRRRSARRRVPDRRCDRSGGVRGPVGQRPVVRAVGEPPRRYPGEQHRALQEAAGRGDVRQFAGRASALGTAAGRAVLMRLFADGEFEEWLSDTSIELEHNDTDGTDE